MADANLSGAEWWRANQARYPNSRDVDDLAPSFRSNVQDFIGSLRDAGARVTVSSTRRNATRAHLMHYSWRVAHGDVDPADVPRHAGLDIEWDHGDLDASRRATREMVELFNMAHVASLRSNHIRGLAIDMTISWRGELLLTRPAPLQARIETGPRTGGNRELHRIGADVFGVRKLLNDPPHWSQNGR